MPAAAVIPAPIAYAKVVAVKKLVVGFLMRGAVHRKVRTASAGHPPGGLGRVTADGVCRDVYFEEIRVFKAGQRLNTLAWNNGIGLRFYFVGF